MLAALAGLLALAAGCGDDAAGGSDLRGATRTPPLAVGDASLPDVTDEPPRPFGFRAPEGRLLVVYFGYTHCPDVCPTTLADVRDALAELGADAAAVRVVFATVDPERDTPELLRSYLDHFTDDGRVLRTTDPDELQAAMDAFRARAWKEPHAGGDYAMAHTASTYVVDATGTVVVEWPFGTGAEDMAHDLRLLLGPA